MSASFSDRLACLLQGCGRRSGKYLCVVYLSVKLLYLVNVAGNFVLLTVFLDAEFWRYGITVLSHVIVSGDWHDPVNFPRLLLCDFRLHQSGDQTEVAVSCHSVSCFQGFNSVSCFQGFNSARFRPG